MENKQLWQIFKPCTEKEANAILNSPSFPLNKFVGNAKARARISRFIKLALMREDHSLEEQSFALLGPASVGKTTLAKKIAECVNIPFVGIEPLAVDTTQEILNKIGDTCKNWKITVNGIKTTAELEEVEPGKIVLPPMIVFCDEVHNLSKNCVQGLLKATEKKDGILDTGNWIVDCRKVCWIIATTEAGKLFTPFQTRFMKIGLNLYSEEEIAQIVSQDNDWGIEVSKLVAKYGSKVPREALQFASEMKAEANGKLLPNWEEIAKTIAFDNEIDLDWCMTKNRINVLKSLAYGAVSKNRMCNILKCQVEELERMIMPTLMEEPALVTVSTCGYVLTKIGVDMLEKHKIPHSPMEVLLEYIK